MQAADQPPHVVVADLPVKLFHHEHVLAVVRPTVGRGLDVEPPLDQEIPGEQFPGVGVVGYLGEIDHGEPFSFRVICTSSAMKWMTAEQKAILVQATADEPEGMAAWARTVLLEVAKRKLAKIGKKKQDEGDYLDSRLSFLVRLIY